MFQKRTAYFPLLLTYLLFLTACVEQQAPESATESSSSTTGKEVINVYTHRHYKGDQEIFTAFTEKTGIEVNVVSASADELIKKLSLEGEKSPADVLITVDAGRLVRAKNKGLTQPIQVSDAVAAVPDKFKDKENQWIGLTYRARVLVYNPDKVAASDLSSYEGLTEEKWKNRILTRSSDNIYNQSLVASIIAHKGLSDTEKWAEGLVNNFARPPKGNDRDQIKAVVAGIGDVAIVNSYYLGKMAFSSNKQEREVAQKVGIFFPNQEDRGTHINVSGIAMTKHAPNPENAQKLIDFLLTTAVQEQFASTNFEYPVLEDVPLHEMLTSWGEFKKDELPLHQLGEHHEEAVMIFDRIGWK